MASRSYLPVALDARVNGRILLFTVLACVAATLLSGIVPAWQVTRADLNDQLKEGGRSGTLGASSHRLRGSLVIAELSLAIMALVCAGLLVRSFEAARTVNPQFDPDHVLMSRFYINTTGYDIGQRKQFRLRLRRKLETEPSVTNVAYSDVAPLGLFSDLSGLLEVEGHVPSPGENMQIHLSVVSPGYFRLMRIPVLEGRDFTEQDDETRTPVMIVNQTFVKRFFAGQDPIGRKVHGQGQWFKVIGEVKDSKYINLTEAPLPFFYVPFRQVYRADMGLTFYIRTTTDPNADSTTLRQGLVVGQGLPLTLIGISAGMAASLAFTRLLASFLYGTTTTDPTTFIAVPLLLAGVALFATYIPARRATKVDPMVALRHE